MKTIADVATRFWARVAVGGSDECWSWLKWKTDAGYGRFSYWDGKRTRTVTASRFAWELKCGPIPVGKEVCHNCPGVDNPACCNPAHLWLGSHLQNARDRKAKGGYSQMPRGGNSSRALLCEEEVREMLERRLGGAKLKELAADYGVDITTVSVIAKGKNWAHLGLGLVRPSVSTNAQAAKTHCPQGHAYNEMNTGRCGGKSPYRYCRACRRAKKKSL
jgi:hypothetical protein